MIFGGMILVQMIIILLSGCFGCSNKQMIRKISDKHSSRTKSLKLNEDTTSTLLNNLALGQPKVSYSEYISKFGNDVDESSNAVMIQKSLDEMRIVIKQLNIVLNKMMEKNYEFLAGKDINQNDPQKQADILRSTIENGKKTIQNQEAEMTSLSNLFYEMESKQAYLQSLNDQIFEMKSRIPTISLQSKQNVGGINRNGYSLLNQQQISAKDRERIKILFIDLEGAKDRLRKVDERYENLVQKQKELIEKDKEMTLKLQSMISMARETELQVTKSGTIISYDQKYQQAVAKRNASVKNKALMEHVAKSNQADIQKKIRDYKKLAETYALKQTELNNKIESIGKEIETLIEKNNLVVSNLTQRSLPLKFVETLLKGQRQKGSKNISDNDKNYYDEEFDLLEEIVNKDKMHNFKQKQDSYSLKPNLGLMRKKNALGENKYERSKSVQEIDPKAQKLLLNKSMNVQEINNGNLSKNKSYNFKLPSKNEVNRNETQRYKNHSLEERVESPILKHWKDTKSNDTMIFEGASNEEKDYKIPRLNMKIKKRIQSKDQGKQENNCTKNEEKQLIEVPIVPKFTRLSQKRAINNKSKDEYFDYLEEKGRKILGLS